MHPYRPAAQDTEIIMSDICPITRDGAVAILTLNRPEQMNAYNGHLHFAMLEAVETVNTDPSVRAVVVTGAGRAFCAGADFREGFNSPAFKDVQEIKDGIVRDAGGILNLAIFESDKPFIAAVNGAAVGIGATMLLPMDIRIASNKAKFSFPFTQRGIVFDGAASFLLPRIAGWAKAYEWSLKGDLFSAQEALDAGYMNELTEPGDELNRALDIAQHLATNCSPASLARNKQLLRASMLGATPMQAHMMESDMLQKAFASPDCTEGVTAFMEKRAPKFEDFKPD